jgi:hypothetical protein
LITFNPPDTYPPAPPPPPPGFPVTVEVTALVTEPRSLLEQPPILKGTNSATIPAAASVPAAKRLPEMKRKLVFMASSLVVKFRISPAVTELRT